MVICNAFWVRIFAQVAFRKSVEGRGVGGGVVL